MGDDFFAGTSAIPPRLQSGFAILREARLCLALMPILEGVAVIAESEEN
jgi:hypothetical protein